MGNCLRLGISKIGLAWTKRRMKTSVKLNDISILILGTQAVGKTTISLRLWKYKRSLPDLNYVQTKGFNTYAIRRKNKSTINLYDLGGHPSIQELWDHYYADAHGVIFVVDVSDQAGLPDAGLLFAKVLSDERIREKPILLLANKQDLGGATELELDSLMNLQEVVNSARCLTRLDESTAIDLKNDKGIFEGFRWLVSHIQNHYHELNDRVLHDILEEKNREKTRRAAFQTELEESSTSALDNNDSLSTNNQPATQKTLPSRAFIRDESSVDLQQSTNEFFIPTNAPGPSSPSNPKKSSTDVPTNYLIRSRPNSSIGDTNNPFLVHRNVSTAPTVGRRSLPAIHSFSGKGKAHDGSNFFTSAPSNAKPSSAIGQIFNKIFNDSSRGSESELIASVPVSESGYSMATVTGRLSPEGADSDEGIINPAFEMMTENEHFQNVTNEGVINEDRLSNPVDTQSVPNFNGTDIQIPFCSPDKFRKLMRTESSDTERTEEILMVTTLVQVHQDQLSKERCGSTSSTHDSVPVSLSSFKSEDAYGAEIWREDDDLPSDNDGHKTLPAKSSVPVKSYNVFGGNTSRDKLPLPQMNKDKKSKPNVRIGIGKNKTAPFQPGMKSSKGKSLQTDSSLPSNPASKALATSAINGNPSLSLNKRKENDVQMLSTDAKKKLTNRNLSGFFNPQETKGGSQFFKESK